MSKLLTCLCLIALFTFTLSAGGMQCGEAGTTVLSSDSNILSAHELAVTGGTITPIPGDAYGAFTPNPGTEKSFKNMVKRLKKQARKTDRTISSSLLQQCLKKYYFCSIDCKKDFNLKNCKTSGDTSFQTFTLKRFHQEYCVAPRLKALHSNATETEKQSCIERPCSCHEFAPALSRESHEWDGENGSTYQGRFYARVVAYRALCTEWCDSGSTPVGLVSKERLDSTLKNSKEARVNLLTPPPKKTKNTTKKVNKAKKSTKKVNKVEKSKKTKKVEKKAKKVVKPKKIEASKVVDDPEPVAPSRVSRPRPIINNSVTVRVTCDGKPCTARQARKREDSLYKKLAERTRALIRQVAKRAESRRLHKKTRDMIRRRRN